MGWSSLSINLPPKLVCVFSHTSYCDFFLMLLYQYGYELKLKTLIKPCYFNGVSGWLLRQVGGIEATPIDERNGGAVQRIVNELHLLPQYHFMISPKGSILKAEWRSGYFHIARLLNVPIIAVGLDYEEKKVKYGRLINHDNEVIVKELLYEDLKEMIPLYPEQEVMPLRPHGETSVVSYLWYKVILIICIVKYFT